MPLFRRQSEKGRKRQQRQELLAQQDPEPRFDLSDCELQEVPSGVYAICKVLQKEALYLHKNWLGSLHGGGNLSDLRSIRILDVHNNELKSLPDDIGCLQSLQILNLENNKLKKLPDSIGHLPCLQTLNVKSNKLKELAESVCDLPSLRLLDIANNDITELPQRLACVRTLETLQLDASKFKYPQSSVCTQGTEAIMRFLCSENQFEYEPPSKFLLKTLDAPKGISSSQSENSIKTFQDEARLLESVEQYQKLMQQKRQEAKTLEQQLAEESRLQEQLAASAASNKKHLLDTITQDQARMDAQLSELSSQKEEERKRFLETLNSVEERVEGLLVDLLNVNEKAKKTEALLDELEKERMEEDDWFSVRWEELMNLRKQEVLEGMNHMLEEFRMFEQQRQVCESEREVRSQRALQLEEEISSGQVESQLHHKDNEHKNIMETLAEQEALQKQAVKALMLARDAKHSRISSQIALIQSELSQLTVVEMGKRNLRLETEMNVIAEKRIALTGMLAQLLDEQQTRQTELHRRMGEMEQQREEGQTDYWLVQYQRLLDKKPQALIDKESQLEKAVKKILIVADAEDYIPVFARHRITIETMLQLEDADLKQMGVHELGLRKAILKGIDLQRAEPSKLTQKEKDISLLPQLDPSEPQATGANAPPYEPPSAIQSGASATGTMSRQLSITARGINSECVVCLDRVSEVIFLPCGHVCTCPVCTGPLTECPMCRAPISQRIKLSVPAPV